MAEEFDPWKTTSGLPLDDKNVEVQAVEFVTDNTMGAGTIVAKITFDILDDDWDSTGETGEQKYSVGNGWRVTDQGAAIEPEKGGNRGFNNQTNYGMFVDSTLNAAKAAGLETDLRSSLDPRKGSTLVGMRGHLKANKRMTTNPTTGKEKESTNFLWESLASVGGDTAPAPKAAPAKGGAATKPAAKKAPAKKGGITDEQRAELVKLAEMTIETEGKDHGAFMAAALADDTIAGDVEMTKAVMDDGDGSIWAEVAAQYE